MADQETMAAYAANSETYRKVVSDAGGNSMLDSFMEQPHRVHAFSTSMRCRKLPPPCRRRDIS